MIRLRLALPLLLAACGATPPAPPVPAAPAASAASTAAPAKAHVETDLVSNARQLIFTGKRSGEGYYSADGDRMVFQSERLDANPFYQIFLLDLESGDTEQITNGTGKTSCAWIHPTENKVLFASTHEDPEALADQKAEIAIRASGKHRRYSWDYDKDYDLFESVPGSGTYTNLTKTTGYNAEGSWSPDGKHILFASNRLAFSTKMSPEDQAGFDRDPAYMMDLYIMDADGSNVRQLTTSKGYDGGPFFSPDGKRLTWRRFTPDGHQAEIWTMNIDGTDAKQLTRLKAMSWAPYYHPSGDYLIFNSNLEGFQNFELYLVDVEGTKKPVRITFTDGWDGLPVFSPDGKKLAWSAGRTDNKKPQLFTADWNDAKARELLALAPARDGAVVKVAAQTVDLSATKPGINAADMEAHVRRLASPEFEGRLTGTPGEAKATAYVAEVFNKIGLQGAGTDGFFQPFTFTSGVSLNQPNVLLVQVGDTKTRPKVSESWRPLAFSKPGSIAVSDLVFAGYGIVAPKQSDTPDEAAYDAYGALDVTDKWVVVLRFMPEDITPERRQALSRFASLRFKAMEARDRGAKGLIVVSGPKSQAREQLVPLRFDAAIAGAGLPAITVTDAFATEIFGRAKQDLAAAQTALDKGEIAPGFALPGTQIGGHFTLKFDESTGRNVLARLQVGATPSSEVLIIGAHVDHLGHGEGGDTLAKGDEKGKIHFGADDNASGVAGLLEIAQYLADQKAKGKLAKAKRDIIFAAWSGEELGLLGASYFVRTYGGATEAPKTIYPQVAAYLNMDMIGRLREKLVLQGVGSSGYWTTEVEKRNVVVGLPISLSVDTYLPTDATPFYLKGVPILAAFTGAHGEYHTPRDTPDLLNYEGSAKIAKLVGLIGRSLLMAEKAPPYVKIAPPKKGPGRRQGRAYLGTIPDYAGSATKGGPKGVPLSGVANNSPAQKAGAQAGDVLVGLAGKPIDNIYDFVRVLQGLKVGQAVEMKVMRGGALQTLKATPISRE
jgi:Tol biopolymer transport system component